MPPDIKTYMGERSGNKMFASLKRAPFSPAVTAVLDTGIHLFRKCEAR